MEITEVRIKLTDDSDDRLQAFCSITFDNAFVVRDLKIIDGNNGPFVAMPSRKLTAHCPKCGYKNHLRAHYCNQCGARFREDRAPRDPEGRVKLYADIAHPINAGCREMIQSRVIAEFEAELERAKDPNYRSRYDEDYDVDFESDDADPRPHAPPVAVEKKSAAVDAFPLPADSPAPASPSTPVGPAAATPIASPAPNVSATTVEERSPSRTVIPEPAAQEPRPPHRVPSNVPPPAKPNRGSSQFGAGIFD